MPTTSAGLLMYHRPRGRGIEVLLAHPGGPYFRRKDLGSWTIPKGLIEPGEDPLAAACREFREETSLTPQGPWIDLGTVLQKGGKKVYAWACEGDCLPSQIVSGTFQIEWPPRSGQMSTFPEVDRAEFFDLETARLKCLAAQVAFIDRLESILSGGET
ncbi:NUDIX domain-containing protein [Planctomicrobium sp. SH661]|uniref:NUDIX domain-containing protein n=1 Tax=Planctomicrobium sp. SH661 TaxID=3448124 RepID=UPI003F5B21EF